MFRAFSDTGRSFFRDSAGSVQIRGEGVHGQAGLLVQMICAGYGALEWCLVIEFVGKVAHVLKE